MSRIRLLGMTIVLAAATLTGCSSDSHAGHHLAQVVPAGGSATLGDLQITGVVVPAPASPDVAAAYFTVANHGSSADQLVAVTSNVSTSTSLHGYAGTSMIALSTLAIAGGATISLHVGGPHVMIMSPTRTLIPGQSVRLTLKFRSAGQVTINALIIEGTGPQGDDMTSMPGMTMPGMTMPGMK